MKARQIIFIEFFLLFVVFPLVVCLPINIWIKIVMGVSGFVYVLKILRKVNYVFFRNDFVPFPKRFFKQVLAIFSLLVLGTIFYMNSEAPEKLFFVVINKPLVWIVILFVYSLLSVLPQEIIYRSFFVHRYNKLFQNKWVLIFVNAFVFSLGHLFFQNTLVMVLTFFGGLIFSYSYLKTKSLLLVFIEHTIYGYWLFTVGMGEMLGFPS